MSDGFVVAARFSESAAATLTIKNKAGKTVKKLSSTGEIARLAWNLKAADGALVPDGAYTWSLRVVDAWANTALTRSGTFTVDGTAPVSRAVPEATAGDNGWFVSPVSMTLTAKDALSGVRSIAWRIDGGTATGYDGPVRITGDGVRDARVPGHGQGRRPGGLEVGRAQDRHAGARRDPRAVRDRG